VKIYDVGTGPPYIAMELLEDDPSAGVIRGARSI
jgi:hypothetical protein